MSDLLASACFITDGPEGWADCEHQTDLEPVVITVDDPGTVALHVGDATMVFNDLAALIGTLRVATR